MRMRKGFTLAEILVTLTIVGVIASLTVPQLVNNVQKNTAGATLGKVVEQLGYSSINTIQTANSNLANSQDFSMHEVLFSITRGDLGVNDDTSTTIIDDLLEGCADIYGMTWKSNDNKIEDLNIKTYSRTAVKNRDDETDGKGKLYSVDKVGAEVWVFKTKEAADAESNNDTDFAKSLTSKLLITYIDVNGFGSKPNQFGKDIFKYYITNSGKMVPFGIDSYKTDCVDNSVTNGLACTARVEVDKFSIKY